MHDAGYLNTQESAFALLALGKIARRAQASTATATLSAGGKTLGQFTGQDLTVRNVANYQLLLKALSNGPLCYYWPEEGVSGRGREEDRYLPVRRYFADRTGKPLAGTTFRQNDLVLVVIALQSAAAAGEVRNVAITNLLPAGLEIENPRLGVQRDVALPSLAIPDYLDVRDDRLNLFTTATPRVKVFACLARAVSKGTFQLGPVSADAMYNAEYHSYHGAGVVRVR